MTSSRIRCCAASRCLKAPTFTSRCSKHWLRRLDVYLLLPTQQLWWRIYEERLVEALDMRYDSIMDGGNPAPADIQLPPSRVKWRAHLAGIVEMADEAARRKYEQR